MSDDLTSPDTLTGAVLGDGKYEVGELIGEGAMGTVYRGRHTALNRTVAIKVLHPEIMNRPKVADRFRREARAASRLQHPNSVQVLDFGEEDRHFYIVMEFLEGRSLGALIEDEGALSTPRIVHMMTGVCRALARAHDLGIIHRDMKPDNIVVFPGVDDDGHPVERVKVCDFGIAKIQQGGAGDSIPTITEVGQVSGTPHYMSPEQCQAMELDARSDIYSCGVVLYHMATGAVPFDAGSAVNVMVMHISREPQPPSAMNPDVSPGLEEIIRKAMAKDPDDRYPDVRALRRALEALVGAVPASDVHPAVALPPRASEPSTDGPAPASTGSLSGVAPPRRRKGWLVGGAALIALAIAVPLAVDFDAASPEADDRTGGPEAATVEREAPPPDPAAVVAVVPDAARDEPTPEPDKAARAVPAVPDSRDVDRADATASADGTAADTPAGTPEAPTAGESEPAEPAPRGVVAKPAPAPKPSPEPAPKPSPAPAPKPKPKPRPEEPTPTPASATDAPEESPAVERAAGEVASPEPSEAGSAPDPDEPPEPSVGTRDEPDEPAAPDDPAPEPERPASFDAEVRVAGLDVTGSLPASTIRRAVRRFRGAFAACYHDRARAQGRAPTTTVRVRVTIDEDGRARGVRADGGALPGLDACVRDVAWKIRTRTRPDTGIVDASFAIQFRPETD